MAERKRQEKEAAEKKALIERLQKHSGVSDAQALKKVTSIIQKAVSNGLSEVEVYRFPSTLCTDRGVAINNPHAGWEETLVGLPKEMYEFWQATSARAEATSSSVTLPISPTAFSGTWLFR